MSKLREYLDGERGRGVKAAADLDVTPGAIWQWAENQVPGERVIPLEKVTGISRHELRPDLYPIEDTAA
jgi:DNA-binding transcriptional regulator YdaS (Cro superfamily)